jgi:glutathione S-transferase
MSELTLVVGDKNLSSWSMRPYLALKHVGVPFKEVVIILDQPDTAARIAEHSPTGRVPVLLDGGLRVWDSLAIIEYLAERFPEAKLWPADRAARAMARSACAEMHSGFPLLRSTMSVNVTARRPLAEVPAPVQQEVSRMEALWRACRAAHGSGGPFLFGTFSAADCFFAPVVVGRFITYGARVEADTRAYMDAVVAHPVIAKWIADAGAEAKVTGSDKRLH